MTKNRYLIRRVVHVVYKLSCNNYLRKDYCLSAKSKMTRLFSQSLSEKEKGFLISFDHLLILDVTISRVENIY